MKLLNYTPHDIHILSSDGTTVLRTIPSSGVARVRETLFDTRPIEGVPVDIVRYGSIEGLPDGQMGTYYIVSLLVAQVGGTAGGVRRRYDLLVPGVLHRDPEGRILGCSTLRML